MNNIGSIHISNDLARRYGKMLERAGFAPAVHLTHLESLQNKKGADAMRLGVVSEKHYHDICSRRAFDEFFFQIPLTKRCVLFETHRKVRINKTCPTESGYLFGSRRPEISLSLRNHILRLLKNAIGDIYNSPQRFPAEKSSE